MRDLTVLHALRIRGVLDAPALAETLQCNATVAESAVEELVDRGLLAFWERGSKRGWRITKEGLEQHDVLLQARRSPEWVSAVGGAYEQFLAINAPAKELFTRWQALGSDDGAGRWECVEELAEGHPRVTGILGHASVAAPWFASYRQRFDAALEQIQAGQEQFFTDPTIDSYHTVWFECHEDLLVTLGKARSEADGV